MNAAFGLFSVSPASSPTVLSRAHDIGAGQTAYRRIPSCGKWMARQCIAVYVILHVPWFPMSQWIDLDASVVPAFEMLQLPTSVALVALAAGDPCVEWLKSRLQGFCLSKPAAGIRVKQMKDSIRIPQEHLFAVRPQRPDIRKPQSPTDVALICKGLGKVHSGIEKQDGSGMIQDRYHVQKHHGLNTEGTDKRRVAYQWISKRVLKHGDRAVVAEAAIEFHNTLGSRSRR